MMPAAAPPAQVAIDCLPSLYMSLTTALSKAGFSSGQTEEIFSKYVSAECVLCGIRINGDDIAHIAVLEKKVRYYGHLPLLQKPHKYTIDPVSVAPEPPR